MAEEDITVHEGRRTGIVVSVRLKPDEADLLQSLSERDGRTMSETMRVALNYLASAPIIRGSAISLGEGLNRFTRGDQEPEGLETALVGASTGNLRGV